MKLVLEGDLIPITNLFNEQGEEVTDIDQAFTFVAGPLPDGQWLSDRLDQYIIYEAQ